MDELPSSYPFPDDAVGAVWHRRERLICGGYTTIEWNQRGAREIAFACSHGPDQGCGWRISLGNTDGLNVLFIAEIDYADEVHREYAWRQREHG